MLYSVEVNQTLHALTLEKVEELLNAYDRSGMITAPFLTVTRIIDIHREPFLAVILLAEVCRVRTVLYSDLLEDFDHPLAMPLDSGPHIPVLEIEVVELTSLDFQGAVLGADVALHGIDERPLDTSKLGDVANVVGISEDHIGVGANVVDDLLDRDPSPFAALLNMLGQVYPFGCLGEEGRWILYFDVSRCALAIKALVWFALVEDYLGGLVVE